MPVDLRQLVFRAGLCSPVERDDRAHLDRRGKLDCGAACQADPAALCRHTVQDLVRLAARLVGPSLEEVGVHARLQHRPRDVRVPRPCAA